MKYWFDTEFIEDGVTIDLLSIGVVCEDGREFYAQNRDANLDAASEWVRDNVFPGMRDCPDERILHKEQLRSALYYFIEYGEGTPEFWAYYGDYDWVVLCQLFGTMMDLPEGWPMFAMDVKQLAVSLGSPELPPQDSAEHNALNDARWTRDAWKFLAVPVLETPPPLTKERLDALIESVYSRLPLGTTHEVVDSMILLRNAILGGAPVEPVPAPTSVIERIRDFIGNIEESERRWNADYIASGVLAICGSEPVPAPHNLDKDGWCANHNSWQCFPILETRSQPVPVPREGVNEIYEGLLVAWDALTAVAVCRQDDDVDDDARLDWKPLAKRQETIAREATKELWDVVAKSHAVLQSVLAAPPVGTQPTKGN